MPHDRPPHHHHDLARSRLAAAHPTRLVTIALTLAATASPVLAQASGGPGAPTPGSGDGGGTQSLLQVINAGGVIGYIILLLSLVGLALVIDGFLRVRESRLMPPELLQDTQRLAQRGQFGELRERCGAHPSLWGQLVGHALAQGNWGVEAVRETLEQEGTKRFTRLRQRIGYIGLIASIAPLLGLLGTVTGMIRSFHVLGAQQAAARADQLAVGISEALVTTCMGLIVAVPLLFLHAYLRDRVAQLSQEAAAQGERLIRIICVVHANPQRTQTTTPAAAQPAPAQAPPAAAQPTPAAQAPASS